jgi:2,4-dienoyl-CoA reductase-like NADH-dependent reductase (Old Yellow Enzyme family)
MSILFSPLTIKGITFKNRLIISPMCQYSSTDGFATDWHLVHLGSRAIGGAALVIQEATAVSPEGRISPGDIGIWKDEHIEKLKTITSFIHEHGSVAGIQLAHAGRKASCKVPWEGGKQIKSNEGGWQTVAPSAIPFKNDEEVPVALSKEGIRKVVTDFKAAAARAVKAGYKVIEIHAAHGYLINEFLSPLSNQRADEYGGSFENRTRFLLEIIEAIQILWPTKLPLFVRISSTDWVEGGWTEDDSVKLAELLKGKGIDLVDCSSGGVSPHQKIPVAPGYQVPFAEKLRKTGILTGAVGLITESKQAEEILKEGKADFIFIARQSLRDPYFALTAAEELKAETEWPKQYLRAKRYP